MSWIDPERGTVLVATVSFTDSAGDGQMLALDVIGLDLGGVRERDFLDRAGAPVPFADRVPQMTGGAVLEVTLSIAYPTGAFEVTPPIPLAGDIGLVAWAAPVRALADPAPIGDPMIDPVFVVTRRHAPNPSVSP